ncbi:MAG: D-aminoacyl-tRNA deacylase [Eubacteriales bacterium]
MTAVVQRIKGGCVRVGGEKVGEAGPGLFVLLGVAAEDEQKDAELLASKILKLRIFSDDAGKMNLSVTDVGGDILLVSNFTLLADYRRGNRPDFLRSAPPDKANELYEYFAGLLSAGVGHVGTGRFGAHMEIEVTCDGPVTIIMESEVLRGRRRGTV